MLTFRASYIPIREAYFLPVPVLWVLKMELNELKIGVASGLVMWILFCSFMSLPSGLQPGRAGMAVTCCREPAGPLVACPWTGLQALPLQGWPLWDAKEAGSQPCGGRTLEGDRAQSSEAWLGCVSPHQLQPQPAGLILGGLGQKYSWEKGTKNSPLFLLGQLTSSDERPAPFKLGSSPVIMVTKPRGWWLNTRKACVSCWFVAAVATSKLFLLSSRNGWHLVQQMLLDV